MSDKLVIGTFDHDPHDCEVVEHPLLVWEVAGFIPGWVIPKTLKTVVTAALLSGVAGLALQLTGWYQDKWTNRTCNLPRKKW